MSRPSASKWLCILLGILVVFLFKGPVGSVLSDIFTIANSWAEDGGFERFMFRNENLLLLPLQIIAWILVLAISLAFAALAIPLLLISVIISLVFPDSVVGIAGLLFVGWILGEFFYRSLAPLALHGLRFLLQKVGLPFLSATVAAIYVERIRRSLYGFPTTSIHAPLYVLIGGIMVAFGTWNLAIRPAATTAQTGLADAVERLEEKAYASLSPKERAPKRGIPCTTRILLISGSQLFPEPNFSTDPLWTCDNGLGTISERYVKGEGGSWYWIDLYSYGAGVAGWFPGAAYPLIVGTPCNDQISLRRGAIYSEPSFSGSPVRVYHRHDYRVRAHRRITNSEGAWYWIDLGKHQGWCSVGSDCVVIGSVPDPPDRGSPQRSEIIVTKGSALKESPSASSPTLWVREQDTYMIAETYRYEKNSEGQWYWVALDGVGGWICTGSVNGCSH